jgi:hypothetical protein
MKENTKKSEFWILEKSTSLDPKQFLRGILKGFEIHRSSKNIF